METLSQLTCLLTALSTELLSLTLWTLLKHITYYILGKYIFIFSICVKTEGWDGWLIGVKVV